LTKFKILVLTYWLYRGSMSAIMKINNSKQLAEVLILRRVSFLITFFFVFLLTYSLLAWVDFLPEPVTTKPIEEEKVIQDERKESKNTTKTTLAQVSDTLPGVESGFVGNLLPEKITFDSLNRSVVVFNPTSRKVADLDKSLLNGVVRHPDSATLDQNGTVFILGHSSYLPKVVNDSFQAFNGIQNLKWGDIIRIEAGESVYIYRVDKVYKAQATDTMVPIAGEKKRLVLATCNSFGSTDDRFIVEAELSEIKTKNT